MRRGRFCEILKPRRNGYVRCGYACDKLAQTQRGRWARCTDAADKVRARAILKFIKPLKAV